jgi:hypothetical protein
MGRFDEGISQLVHWLLVLEERSQVVDLGLPVRAPRVRRSLFRFEGAPPSGVVPRSAINPTPASSGCRARRRVAPVTRGRRPLRIA